MKLLNQFVKDLHKVAKSRTILTVTFLMVFNIFSAVSDTLPIQAVVLGNVILTTLASYFRINVKQNYAVKAK